MTGLATFDFDGTRFALANARTGSSVEEIRQHTGFDFDTTDACVTPPPGAEELALLRGPVFDEVAELYPSFVAARRGG